MAPTARVDADRIIDGGTHLIELHLPTELLLEQLRETFAEHPHLWGTFATAVHSDPQRARWLPHQAAIRDALTLQITRHAANDLAEQLDQAAVEPDRCWQHTCTAYAVADDVCDDHRVDDFGGGDAA